MPLINLQTNLKSLRFGKDRPGSGDSGQPYITTRIPGTNEPTPGRDLDAEDYFLRGGINAARDAATDVVRLGKFLLDDGFKNIDNNTGAGRFLNSVSTKGVLFASKQNSLSSIAVRTQASNSTQNEGIYTPLSTLAQAGIGFIGGRVTKQGNIISGPIKYESLARNEITQLTGFSNSLGGTDINITDEVDNRLIQLTKLKIGTLSSYLNKPLTRLNKTTQISNDPNVILSYRGGPNSDVGVGSTNIKIATNNKGAPLRTIYRNDETPRFKTWSTENIISLGTGEKGDLLRDNEFPYLKHNEANVAYTTMYDFRRPLIENEKTSTIMSLAPSYNPANNKTIDGPISSRINYTAPGQRGNVIDYDQGKRNLVTGEKMGPVDRINALPIYKTTKPGLPNSSLENDLIKFRIGAMMNSNPNEKEYVNFRAYIDSFSDSYSAQWNAQQYMGRGESFYKYGGFTRDVNMSFTVAAQSKEEIMVMYRKLNFLVSNLTPEYSDSGYMGGPLVTLTLGAWCYELPGFIKSITLDVPQESPWEIGIPNLDRNSKSIGGITYRNPSVKEMPHICRVTGFTFTPIHKFRPQKQTLGVKGSGAMKPSDIDKNTLQDKNIYGNQRYIALANGLQNPNSKGSKSVNNYDNLET